MSVKEQGPKFSRREFVKIASLIVGSTWLAACQRSATAIPEALATATRIFGADNTPSPTTIPATKPNYAPTPIPHLIVLNRENVQLGGDGVGPTNIDQIKDFAIQAVRGEWRVNKDGKQFDLVDQWAANAGYSLNNKPKQIVLYWRNDSLGITHTPIIRIDDHFLILSGSPTSDTGRVINSLFNPPDVGTNDVEIGLSDKGFALSVYYVDAKGSVVRYAADWPTTPDQRREFFEPIPVPQPPLKGMLSAVEYDQAAPDPLNPQFVFTDDQQTIAKIDKVHGALFWNSDKWAALKDTDKTQIASWMAGMQKEGINFISIAQPDGSTLLQLVNGKNLLPVKIAKDSDFQMVFDKTVNKNVVKVNGTVFAWQDGQTWTLGVETKQNELQTINTKGFMEKFPNAIVVPEVIQQQGKKILLHLVRPDGIEIVSYTKGEFATDQGILVNWDIFGKQEQLDLAKYFMQNYHYGDNFPPDQQKDLMDRVLFWIQRFPDKLPTLDEIGLTGFVNQSDYDQFFNRNAILTSIATVNSVQRIAGTTNYAGILIGEPYHGDQMAIWFFKEAMVSIAGGNANHQENVSTALIVAIDKIMAQNGVNSGINPEFQKKRVRGEEPYPKPR